jgi:hypothetical protein
MPRSTTCETETDAGWTEASVEEALKVGSAATKRCIECHGRVKAHKESPKQGAHFEHQRRHKGCPLGDCYDGVKRPHPMALT